MYIYILYIYIHIYNEIIIKANLYPKDEMIK